MVSALKVQCGWNITYRDPACSHLTDQVWNEVYASAHRRVTKSDLKILRYIIYGREEDEAAEMGNESGSRGDE